MMFYGIFRDAESLSQKDSVYVYDPKIIWGIPHFRLFIQGNQDSFPRNRHYYRELCLNVVTFCTVLHSTNTDSDQFQLSELSELSELYEPSNLRNTPTWTPRLENLAWTTQLGHHNLDTTTYR